MMNRVLLLTYGRPIVPVECVIAAVNSVSAAFLGRDGVVSVTDAMKDGRACVLVLVDGPLDGVLARLPQNVAGVPVFALRSGALRPIADVPTFASAGEPAAAGKPPWADSTDNHPVNPFALARLMTGKIVRTRDELVAAFGMPLDKILAVGGPLYAPDLAAIAARRQQSANGSVKGSKPAGAVGDASKSSQKITPPKSSVAPIVKLASGKSPAVTGYRDPIIDQLENFSGGVIGCSEWLEQTDEWRRGTLIYYALADATNAQAMAERVTNACRDSGIAPATNLNVRSGDATKVRDWVTPVQDPAVREHYTEDPTTIAARRAWSTLNTYFPCPNGVCDTCRDWRRLTPDAKRELLLSYHPFSLAGVTRENVESVVANIDARCATIASSASYRGVRDSNRLLTATGHGTNDWAELTCQQQFDALARINADLVPPRVTIDEMKRELFEQWITVSASTGLFLAEGPRSWFFWSRIGAYASHAVSVSDAKQGCVGNCFFVASLAGAAWVRPGIIAARSWDANVRSAGDPAPAAVSNPSVTITFSDPRSGSNVSHAVTMSDRLPLVINPRDMCDGSQPLCHSQGVNQTWPGLWEKAFRVWLAGRDNPPMVPDLRDGNSDTNARAYFVSNDVHPAINFAGGDGQTFILWYGARGRSTAGGWLTNFFGANPTIETIWRYLDEHCDTVGKIKSVVFACSIAPDWSPPAGIVPSHAYTLLGIDRARRMVYLRNPWGHISPGAPADQRGSWMGLALGNDDGVGVVTLQSFYDNYVAISGNYYGPRQMNDYGLIRQWDTR
jgi:hypothetical protein